MPVTVIINGQTASAAPGISLFDCAERLRVHVPTSCLKQGKCKECIVEVVEGMDCLSARTPHELHLRGNFRLSCRSTVTAAAGQVRCHTMRRGRMRIENRAVGLPARMELSPAVTRVVKSPRS